jgi:mannitol/fructose-specific phosphotransferase system IIA component (Ntr-type)
MVDLLENAHDIHSQGEILMRVLHREEGQTTGIGNGVAIPHGKARAVNRMVAACGVAPDGVDFQSVDGEPATLFVLLAAPMTVGSLQVKVLANISRVLKEEGVRQSLRDAANPESSSTRARGGGRAHPVVKRRGHPAPVRGSEASMHLLEAWTTLGPCTSPGSGPPRGDDRRDPAARARARPRRGVGRRGRDALLLVEMALPWWIRAAWVGAWLGIAWQAGRRDRPDLPARPPGAATRGGRGRAPARAGTPRSHARRRWRPDVPAEDARRASLGALLVGLGLCT